MIEKKQVERRRPLTGERTDTRQYSYKYHIRENDGSKVEVCVKTFQSIHGIGLKRVRRVRMPPTVAPEDKRGTHTHRTNRISEELKDQIKQRPVLYYKKNS